MTPERLPIDERPGPAPDIRLDDESIIFTFRLDDSVSGSRLMIRCDAKGNMWVAIILSQP
jgi:hypothetical protein